ncbi:hypothetical protein ACO2Q2_17295 [Dyella sp. KRB-257]|uniref:hypothetical protein n=1 Tax=Dyella sp. KRB-257 TaxID=3400915 RepID=UPI003C009301
MLGWEIFVYRPTAPDIFIARWMTSVFGLDWLDQLVKDNKVVDLGGGGYPNKYASTARVLLPIIKAGPPAHDSPLVIGDDYVLPQGWSSKVTWNKREVMACSANDQLMLEAWDKS